MTGFGTTFVDLYNNASNMARSAFHETAQSTEHAVAGLERAAQHLKTEAHEMAAIAGQKTHEALRYAKKETQQAKDWAEEKWNAAEKTVKRKVVSARHAVDKKLYPQPAGARIQPCPKNKKAERVAERRAKIAKAKEQIRRLPPGIQRDLLSDATARFERNNVAVERARLAKDVYNVGQEAPPEGWERVSNDELRKLGMTQEMFPQLDPKFNPKEYKDGYYAELYKGKADVFGEERYVLAFRGTKGVQDGKADCLQAFGAETEHYSRAIRTAQKLKAALGNSLEITGHSLGGGMATAAGIVTRLLTYAINPAGVHPATVEKYGIEIARKDADMYVQNYVAEGEVLDWSQDPANQRSLLVKVGAITPVGAAGLLLLGHRAVLERGAVTYDAAGAKYKVPILTNAKDVMTGKSDEGISPGLPARLGNAISLTRKAELHGAEYVIAGLEQQKADDLSLMDRSLRQ